MTKIKNVKIPIQLTNELLLMGDSGSQGVVIVLYLSAAFDLIDCDILIEHLEHVVDLRGTVLKWFSSYLKERSFSVTVGEFSSSSVSINCGVPQGSILGPILLNFFLAVLVFKKHSMSCHLHADDIQIYLPIKPVGPTSHSSLLLRLVEMKCWLEQNAKCD